MFEGGGEVSGIGPRALGVRSGEGRCGGVREIWEGRDCVSIMAMVVPGLNGIYGRLLIPPRRQGKAWKTSPLQ